MSLTLRFMVQLGYRVKEDMGRYYRADQIFIINGLILLRVKTCVDIFVNKLF